MQKTEKSIFLTILVPLYNEQDVIEAFHQRLLEVIKNLRGNFEILYVNDGSTDQSLDLLKNIKKMTKNTSILNLSRNFGKEIAMTAGLDYAEGEAVIIIDVDLQDPPELIPQFITEWQNGYDVVYAQRIERKGESWLKKMTAFLFYRLMRFNSVKIPKDTGDFRLLSRRAVDALRQLRERHRFMKGLFAWIGYPQKAIFYERQPRYQGKTKWGYWKLWNFAIEGITSFTIAPLKIATYLGLITATSAFIYSFIIIYKTVVYGNPVKGYPSLLVVILFLGGIQLFTLGIIGEYLGRMFNEIKGRPLYLIKDYMPTE